MGKGGVGDGEGGKGVRVQMRRSNHRYKRYGKEGIGIPLRLTINLCIILFLLYPRVPLSTINLCIIFCFWFYIPDVRLSLIFFPFLSQMIIVSVSIVIDDHIFM